MDEKTTTLTQNYDNIIYISCNPDTLERDLQQLTTTHKVTRFAIFD